MADYKLDLFNMISAIYGLGMRCVYDRLVIVILDGAFHYQLSNSTDELLAVLS